MEEKTKIVWSVVTGILIFSSLFILIYSGIVLPQRYLLDLRIPGVVEGTAKAIDTESYFAKNELSSYH